MSVVTEKIKRWTALLKVTPEQEIAGSLHRLTTPVSRRWSTSAMRPKKVRDFARANAIRDQLAGEDVLLEDTPQSVRWRRG